MRRYVSLLIVGLVAPLLAVAQAPPVRAQPPGRPAAPEGPKGEQKLRWVCKQLKLDGAQWQQVEALIAVYHASLDEQRGDAQDLMQRVRDKFAEIQAARDAGDEELAKKLQAELRDMAPGVKAENSFFESLEQILTEEQKRALPEVRAKAEKVGDISLRPIHVFRAAQECGLDREQLRKLENMIADFRTGIASNRPEGSEQAAQRVEEFAAQVRTILTPEQARKFDAQLEDMRMGAPAAEPVKLPVPPPPPPTPPTTMPAKPIRPGAGETGGAGE